MTSIADVSDRSIADLISLRGRSAVITGAAQGLGKGIAHRFAEAGAQVAIGDRNIALARETAADLAARHGVKVIALELDAASAASVDGMAARAEAELGGIDIWVNNAGVFPSIPVTAMSETQWDDVFAVNARGTFLGARAAVRSMTARGKPGVIVNIASLAGLEGIAPGLGAYVGSKHAVIGLTKQLAIECAPQRIRVLAVAPSFMVTEGNLAMMGIDPRTFDAAAAAAAAGKADIPSMFTSRLGRVGVPDDIARAALFCASDMSIFMTGTTLVVDAGETA